MSLPLTQLLVGHRPDERTEQKRLYSPPMPFEIKRDLASAPLEVVFDYVYLFFFLFFLGLSFYVMWL